MTKIDIPDLVAKLQQHLATLGDGRDCTSDNEKATYRRTYDGIQRTITGLRDFPDALDRPIAQLADLERRRTAFVEKQAEIEQAMASAQDLSTFADARERDREFDRWQSLKRQLQLLHEGRLLLAPGVAYERLGDLDRRIAEVADRRGRAQIALDAYVLAAEAWLGEPEPVEAQAEAEPVEALLAEAQQAESVAS